MSDEIIGVGCDDCGRQYGNEHGFPDLIITKDAWHRISPTGDDGGLLCPSCLCKRLYDAGIREVEGAFMSGPIKSVDSSLMHNIRWIENLKEQGYGWACPSCYGMRTQPIVESADAFADSYSRGADSEETRAKHAAYLKCKE